MGVVEVLFYEDDGGDVVCIPCLIDADFPLDPIGNPIVDPDRYFPVFSTDDLSMIGQYLGSDRRGVVCDVCRDVILEWFTSEDEDIF